METYVDEHLRDEEALQKEVGYDNFEAHKEQHVIFASKVREIQETINQAGVSLTVIIKSTQMFVNWLVKHIGKDDKAISEFIDSK